MTGPQQSATGHSMMAKGYQHADAFDRGTLSVGEIHTVHYEQYGRKDGKSAIFLHGGPGGGTSSENTAFFDPSIYRVVLLDQRGAGKSRPVAETRENTTQHLVSDIEVLRKHLEIAKWHVVFGGSWGSTLALAYAQANPEVVGSLVLRGIFTGRQLELDYTYKAHYGAAMLYPEAYEKFINFLPEKDREKPLHAYLKLLSNPDADARRKAGRVYNAYESMLSRVEPAQEDFDRFDDDDTSLAHGVLECHYFINGLFLKEGQLLWKENIDKIRHIPCEWTFGSNLTFNLPYTGSIVQGRLDLVCPPRTAWDLHTAWPESKLYFIPLAGHSAKVRSIVSHKEPAGCKTDDCPGAGHLQQTSRGLR